MADPLPASRPGRRWLPQRRAPLATDLGVGFTLFVIEGMLWLSQVVRNELVGWAGDVPRAQVDAASLTGIAWTRGLLFAAIALVLVAAVLYAPVTAVWQGLGALALAGLLALSQYGYDETHPPPTPRPSVWYSPCYSGSGTCH